MRFWVLTIFILAHQVWYPTAYWLLFLLSLRTIALFISSLLALGFELWTLCVVGRHSMLEPLWQPLSAVSDGK
jgi:hypothetical protein